ncbi:cyclase family protein [Pseudoduganella sp. SL102]|uniref:cyclase family protein n=1 Tax=Pseudoduganella sp. SL102 TaxID=2995154 RepID=UPI00248AF2B0|nr:cyclase family protein [Pseudoduganella sp. SL102]WBS05181.1 cyclase family protein [Pseudoduganella sp. SL102]
MSEWIDLTRKLDDDLWIYQEDGYADPPLVVERWAERGRAGFEVWRLALGTQTGTHIDAPCHFADGGATLDTLPAAACVGTYRLVMAGHLADPDFRPEWAGESHLLLDARAPHRAATPAIDALLALPPRMIVMVGCVTPAHDDPLWFHRRVAQAGKFLAEDTLEDIGELASTGDIIALPLRLTGVSGSPARVLVRAGA